MRTRRSILWILTAMLTTACAAAGAEPVNNSKTALDDYIAKADPAYHWKLIRSVPGDGYTTFFVDMTSQRWRAIPEVDRPLWQHWLVIVKPKNVQHDTALLFLGGGSNGKPAPDKPSELSVHLARETSSVVAELRMIPNQPLTFDRDGKGRYEDDLIAYCWNRFMDTQDATWLPRLPMVKSAVRAMDTITALLGSRAGGEVSVRHFVVAGASKRGWTTWLTGAVDRRVVAIVPLVIDVVNVRACSIHHFRSYGFWAPALADYTRHKILERMRSPVYAELLRLVDPYFYRNRLTMPKLVMNAAGDQYFPPDSSQFYFGDLPGPKYLRYVPNTNHSLRHSDAESSILAFYQAILTNHPLPRFAWEFTPDGAIRVKTHDRPVAVHLWQATNPKARDFRLVAIGPAYTQSTLTDQGNGTYVARVPKPAKGWTAFFVELVYNTGGKAPLKLTTQVRIVPDVLPYAWKDAGR